MDYMLRPNSQRAQFAIIMIGIVLVIEVIAIVSGVLQYKLLETAAAGGFVPQAEIEYNDLRERIIAIAYLIAFIISAFTFIQWFRRAYFNLHLKAELLSYTEGWAAGGWFVPFLNLVRPYRIMKELHEETNQLIDQKGMDTKNHLMIINCWWTLWILSNVVGNITSKMYPNPQTIDDYLNATVVDMVSHAFGIPLAIVAMVLIIRQSESENTFAELYASADNN